MGLHSPTPIQAATVPLALLGRDICASAVTGSGKFIVSVHFHMLTFVKQCDSHSMYLGKTIAFSLPILERLLYKPYQTAPCTRVLILAPTRELCVQIHQVFRQLTQFTHNISTCLSTGKQCQRFKIARSQLFAFVRWLGLEISGSIVTSSAGCCHCDAWPSYRSYS
jgi:ATP-dependent RNA helicase DDX27